MSLLKNIKKLMEYKNYKPRKFWNAMVGIEYYNKFPPIGERYENIILEKIENIKPTTIIDIGCGYGRYLKYINNHFSDIELTGVDISYKQIEQATEYCKFNPNIKLMVIDGKTLPLKNKSFDLTITLGCLSAIPYNRIAAFYKEIKRVTSTFGLFLECNKPEKYNNILTSKKYWFYHNYQVLFRNDILNEIPLHPTNGDTLYQMEYKKD